jgi:hypothetical protein
VQQSSWYLSGRDRKAFGSRIQRGLRSTSAEDVLRLQRQVGKAGTRTLPTVTLIPDFQPDATLSAGGPLFLLEAMRSRLVKSAHKVGWTIPNQSRPQAPGTDWKRQDGAEDYCAARELRSYYKGIHSPFSILHSPISTCSILSRCGRTSHCFLQYILGLDPQVSPFSK